MSDLLNILVRDYLGVSLVILVIALALTWKERVDDYRKGASDERAKIVEWMRAPITWTGSARDATPETIATIERYWRVCLNQTANLIESGEYNDQLDEA